MKIYKRVIIAVCTALTCGLSYGAGSLSDAQVDAKLQAIASSEIGTKASDDAADMLTQRQLNKIYLGHEGPPYSWAAIVIYPDKLSSARREQVEEFTRNHHQLMLKARQLEEHGAHQAVIYVCTVTAQYDRLRALVAQGYDESANPPSDNKVDWSIPPTVARYCADTIRTFVRTEGESNGS